MHISCCEISFLFRSQFFHCIVQSIEENVDVLLYILAGFLEECYWVFRTACERSFIEQNVHIVEKHSMQGRHVEFMLFAFLATAFQSCSVCLYDDAYQQMDGHRFVGEADEDAMGVVAHMLFESSEFTL